MRGKNRKTQNFQTWIILSRTKDAISKKRMKEFTTLNISAPQASVLNMIMLLGENTLAADISRWLFREPHTVSNALKKLKISGFITVKRDLERRNQFRINLTEKGRVVVALSKEMESLHRILNCLSRKEIEQLNEYLTRMWYQALEELRRDPRPVLPTK